MNVATFATHLSNDGTVAQLDNASDYGSEDWGFEPLRYHTTSGSERCLSDPLFLYEKEKNTLCMFG